MEQLVLYCAYFWNTTSGPFFLFFQVIFSCNNVFCRCSTGPFIATSGIMQVSSPSPSLSPLSPSPSPLSPTFVTVFYSGCPMYDVNVIEHRSLHTNLAQYLTKLSKPAQRDEFWRGHQSQSRHQRPLNRSVHSELWQNCVNSVYTITTCILTAQSSYTLVSS